MTLDFGLGARQLLRNDGLSVKAQDLKAGRPAIIVYWGGYWFMVGLSASQVPLVATGEVNGWVTCSGTVPLGWYRDTPGKAFRSIRVHRDAVGSRYAASPLLSDQHPAPGSSCRNYERAQVVRMAVTAVSMVGPDNRTAYRITSSPLAQSAPVAAPGCTIYGNECLYMWLQFHHQ